MLPAVDSSCPDPNLAVFLHLCCFGMNEALVNPTPDMELSLAVLVVAVDDAAPELRLILAYEASVVEPFKVELSLEEAKVYVLFVKPDLVVPVDTGLVHPFFRLQLNESSVLVGTKEAARDCGCMKEVAFPFEFLVLLKDMLTPFTEPRLRAVRVSLIELPPVAARVNDNKTALANLQQLIFLLSASADVAPPLHILYVALSDHVRVHGSEVSQLLRDVA